MTVKTPFQKHPLTDLTYREGVEFFFQLVSDGSVVVWRRVCESDSDLSSKGTQGSKLSGEIPVKSIYPSISLQM